jgi:hypothetical protein
MTNVPMFQFSKITFIIHIDFSFVVVLKMIMNHRDVIMIVS